VIFAYFSLLTIHFSLLTNPKGCRSVIGPVPQLLWIRLRLLIYGRKDSGNGRSRQMINC